MGKLKKIQKEVLYLKVLIEDYKGGPKDERYNTYVDKLNGYKKDLQGMVVFLSKSLRENILEDIEYCLKTLENRVEKASSKDILINKVKYELEKLLPLVQQYTGKRNDNAHIQYQNKLMEFSKALHELGTAQRNDQDVKELLIKIEDCSKILENAVKNKYNLYTTKSMDGLHFDDLSDSSPRSKAKNQSTPTRLNKVGLESNDATNTLDEINVLINKIKLSYAVTNSTDIKRLDELSQQILDTYESLEMIYNTDGHQEERKQVIGRTLISLNKKISMDRKEAENKTKGEVGAKLEMIEKQIDEMRNINTQDLATQIKDISQQIEALPPSTQVLEKQKKNQLSRLERIISNQIANLPKKDSKVEPLPSTPKQNGLGKDPSKSSLDDLLQRAAALRTLWESLKADAFHSSQDPADISEIVEILRDVKNDIYIQIKQLQSWRRLSRTVDVRYSGQSFENIQFADDIPDVNDKEHKKVLRDPKTEANPNPVLSQNELNALRRSYPSVEKLAETYEIDKRSSATEKSISFAKSQIAVSVDEPEYQQVEGTAITPIQKPTKEVPTKPAKKETKPSVGVVAKKPVREEVKLAPEETNKPVREEAKPVQVEIRKPSRETKKPVKEEAKQPAPEVKTPAVEGAKTSVGETGNEATCQVRRKKFARSLPPPPSLPVEFGELELNSSPHREAPRLPELNPNLLKYGRHSENFQDSYPPRSKSKEFLNGLSYKDYSLSIQRDAKLLSEDSKETSQPQIYGSTPSINRTSRYQHDKFDRSKKFKSYQDLSHCSQPLPVRIYDSPSKLPNNLFYSFENLTNIEAPQTEAMLINVSSNQKKTITNFTLRTSVSSEKMVSDGDEDVKDEEKDACAKETLGGQRFSVCVKKNVHFQVEEKSLEEVDKNVFEEEQKPVREEQKKSLKEEQKKSPKEEQKKTLEEEQKKTLMVEQNETSKKEQNTTLEEEQMKAFEEEQKKTLEEEQKKALCEQQKTFGEGEMQTLEPHKSVLPYNIADFLFPKTGTTQNSSYSVSKEATEPKAELEDTSTSDLVNDGYSYIGVDLKIDDTSEDFTSDDDDGTAV